MVVSEGLRFFRPGLGVGPTTRTWLTGPTSESNVPKGAIWDGRSVCPDYQGFWETRPAEGGEKRCNGGR